MNARIVMASSALAASAALSATFGAAAGLSGGTYDLSWSSIDGGGVMFAGASDYLLGGTVGQADAGVPLTGGTYDLVGGFWAVGTTLRPSCPADIDGSGTVDAIDLGSLLGNWGGAGVGDLDGSGTVNAADLGILLGSWGTC